MSAARIPLNQQIDEVEQELADRRRRYPGEVSKGRMRQGEADHKITRLTAALKTLEWLRTNEAAIKAKVDAHEGPKGATE